MNLKKRVLFIDADECLLDWLGAFCDWYNKRHGVNYLISTEEFTDYAMSGFPGGEENRAKLMKEFSYTAEYADLNALVQITSLEALVNSGYELRVLTARVDPHPDQRAKLVHNLSRKYGHVFSGVHFLPKSTTPPDKARWIINHFMRDSVAGLVDDKPDTLYSAYRNGLRAFGIMHEFNRSEWETPVAKNMGTVRWCKSVDQVAELLVREAMRDG